MTNKQLSPAAQVVSNAAKSSLDWEAGYLPNAAAGAALRAAADQVVPKHPTRPAWTHVEQIRRDLLAIATELEGYNEDLV